MASDAASDSARHWPFVNSRALIFGAAEGIGRAVALEFARRGAQVMIADIKLDGARSTADLITSQGGAAWGVYCDVTNQGSVGEAAAEADRRMGRVDIVMNLVGAITNGNPEDIPIGEWRRIIDLNLFSVIYSIEHFIPKMLARGSGYIVNTASFAGLYPFATTRMPYVAAKAAVVALSESLALHLHPQGVRVSCLCPGPVMTRIADSMKTWGQPAAFRGPGSQYKVISPEQAAVTLADGMRDKRLIIPTDDQVWEVIRRHWASPDAFVEDRIEAFARGDFGMPSV
jgi:NAD(P)-dependent dehydrogenase (short-subunit alcohol dehydrogenase family)